MILDQNFGTPLATDKRNPVTKYLNIQKNFNKNILVFLSNINIYKLYITFLK